MCTVRTDGSIRFLRSLFFFLGLSSNILVFLTFSLVAQLIKEHNLKAGMAVPIVHMDSCLAVLVFFGHTSQMTTHVEMDQYARFCNGLILSGLFQQEVRAIDYLMSCFLFDLFNYC